MKLILLSVLAVSIILISFINGSKHVTGINASSEISVDNYPGSSPYLAKDNRGNTVLSWVRFNNDSSAVLCYSVLDGSGKTIVISPSSNIHAHAENLPKVIFKPSGEIVAVWGVRNPNPANKYSGLIFYSQSFDNGHSWSPARKLVNDENGIDQRYSDITLLKNGEVAIIWLDNRKSENFEGSALYYAATEGKEGFKNEILVSQPACQCCRTSLFVDNDNNIHALYRGIINDSIRDMVHVVSLNGGRSFSAPERIFNDNWVLRGCPHTGPSMTENEEGLHFAWYTGGVNKGSFYIQSNDNGRTFRKHDSISTVGMHPQIASLPGGRLVIAWDESIKVGENFNKRVGLQVRQEDGMHEIKDFITGENQYSTYPVLSPVDDNHIIVAYTSKQKGKDYIKWQKVNFQM